MKSRIYRKCKKDFSLKNKLHFHLKVCKSKVKNINRITDSQKTFIIIIINFIITLIKENEHNINEQKKIEKTTYFVNSDYFIIELISKKASNIELAFRKWHFVILIIFFTLLTERVIIYINSKCIMSLIDKKILKKILSNIEIKKIRMNINIKEIDTFKYIINDYYLFDLYIFDMSINQ